MKIYLFIKYLAQYGGAERICFRFAEYLKNRGEDVTVICGKNRLKSECPFPFTELGIGRSRYARAKDFYNKASAYANDLNGVIFSFEKMDNAHIIRPGGGVHTIFMKKSTLGMTPLQKLKKNIKRTLDPVNRLNPVLEQRAFSSDKLKTIIAISQQLADEIALTYPYAAAKIQVVHNGVRKQVFSAERRRQLRTRTDNDTVIGFASTNFQLKGLAPLIESLALLPESFRLVIAGDRNPDKYLSMAKKLGVENRIKFLGKVTEMDKFYADTDIFCLPTYFDTFGNVVSEALAMGVPCCVSKYAGSSELIKEGVNGSVIHDITPEKIASSLKASAELKDFADPTQDDDEIFEKYLEISRKVIS
ncbi:MAG: glycosyltransferase family 4 protein [Deferribacterales bacterium]